MTPRIFALFVFLTAHVAAAAGSRLPRNSPKSEGISSTSIREFVEAADAKINTLHSFMLVRHGHVVAEGWWKPETPDKPHVLWSLSKSFASTAVGLSAAEGMLSVEDPVLNFSRKAPPQTPRSISSPCVSSICSP